MDKSRWRNNFVWALLTHYPWDRIKGYYRFASYWQGMMSQLRYEPEQQIYSFRDRIEQAKHRGDRLNAGILAFHEGLLDESIHHLEALQPEDEKGLFWLAMANLRRGLTSTCLGNSKEGARSLIHQCNLPITLNISAGNDHLRRAQALFSKLLTQFDSDNHRYRWLLNLSAMLDHNYPPDRRENWQIESTFIDRLDKGQTRFKTDIRLVNKGRELGIDTHNAGKGVAVEDFDRDGDLDIVTGGFYGPTYYYRNQRGEGFVDYSAESGLAAVKGAHIITAADYDNDGWVDLFLSHPTGTHAYGGFSLLRNQQGKRFVDITYDSGLLNPATMVDYGAFTWTSAWGDIDNDGDLDLFVANWGGKQLINGKPALDSALYLNQDGRFSDVSNQFGLAPYLENNLIVGAAFGDYNNDGFADLALASMLPNFPMLYRNDKGRRFQANTKTKTASDGGFTLAFADLNHDGRLDVFRGVAMVPDDNIRGVVFGHSSKHGHSLVWIQQPDGQFYLDDNYFTKDYPMASMGASFGDLNNDGAYEFYLGTGGPQPWFLLPNLLYSGTLRNYQPTGQLINLTLQTRVGTLAKGHGIVFFDSDNDGDQDMYSSLGGMWPADLWPNEFYVNESVNENSWIKLRLRGRSANYYGLGAMIRITAENDSDDTIIRYYHMDNKTGFGSAPYLAHIGLFNASKLVEVAVRWPGDTSYRRHDAELKRLTVIDQSPKRQQTKMNPNLTLQANVK